MSYIVTQYTTQSCVNYYLLNYCETQKASSVNSWSVLDQVVMQCSRAGAETHLL